MLTRNDCGQTATLACVVGLLFGLNVGNADDRYALQYQSPYLFVSLARQQPSLCALSIDATGHSRFSANGLRPPKPSQAAYTAQSQDKAGLIWQYRPELATDSAPTWVIALGERTLSLTSHWIDSAPDSGLELEFDPALCHATLLGHCRSDGTIALPALLHLPDQGSIRISAPGTPQAYLTYDARRADQGYIRVGFPTATQEQAKIHYEWEIISVAPQLPESEKDPRFAALRRSWLNILQWNPRLRTLANHAASDTCAFCLYEYADIALHTPPLAEGLTALDLIRQSLDRYLDGELGYGLPGYVGFDMETPPSPDPPFLDSHPSLLIAAHDYVVGSDDRRWLTTRYEGLRQWADLLVAMDRDGNGLLEYPYSGNAGSWSGKADKRPSNWWDCIGFGHEDAYGNALAYRALRGMAQLAKQAGKPDDAARYRQASDRLKAAYFDAFYNPDTGVLGGWRSADGQLHDYYFLFVNGIAICYELVPADKAQAIMDRLMAKMREVGYTRFDLGLPGNLVVIPRRDYVHLDPRWGGGQREDNLDGFQRYENGGASACFVYFTLSALYKLDRHAEADQILFPIMASIEQGGFSGRAPNGMTYDWKAWDGTPWGYEGFLVDNYYVLLAALTRARQDRTTSWLAE
jgi:hypothetical protein